MRCTPCTLNAGRPLRSRHSFRAGSNREDRACKALPRPTNYLFKPWLRSCPGIAGVAGAIALWRQNMPFPNSPPGYCSGSPPIITEMTEKTYRAGRREIGGATGHAPRPEAHLRAIARVVECTHHDRASGPGSCLARDDSTLYQARRRGGRQVHGRLQRRRQDGRGVKRKTRVIPLTDNAGRYESQDRLITTASGCQAALASVIIPSSSNSPPSHPSRSSMSSSKQTMD